MRYKRRAGGEIGKVAYEWKILLLFLVMCGCEGPIVEGKLEVVEAWVRGVPASSTVSAAYVVIRNETGNPDTLVLVTSDFSRVVEMHDVEVSEGGVMRMNRLKEIAVAAGGVTQLKPGGRHLMLIGLTQSLANGVYVPLKLTFRKAGMMLVMAKIRREAIED
jgi:copper(I)-binding protein